MGSLELGICLPCTALPPSPVSNPTGKMATQTSDATKKKVKPQVKPLGPAMGGQRLTGTTAPGTSTSSQPKESEDWSKSGKYHLKDLGIKIGASGVSKIATGPADVPEGPSGIDTDKPDPDDLVEERILGKGASGVVVLYRDQKTGKQYAVKIINVSSAQTAAADSKMIAEVCEAR